MSENNKNAEKKNEKTHKPPTGGGAVIVLIFGGFLVFLWMTLVITFMSITLVIAPPERTTVVKYGLAALAGFFWFITLPYYYFKGISEDHKFTDKNFPFRRFLNLNFSPEISVTG